MIIKKEKLKIYQASFYRLKMVTYIIKIDDKTQFIKHYEFFKNKFNTLIFKQSEEVLIDNKMYQKTIYDASGKVIKKEYEIISID